MNPVNNPHVFRYVFSAIRLLVSDYSSIRPLPRERGEGVWAKRYDQLRA